MKAVLFRKIIYEGKAYYQLYAVAPDFIPDDTFADFEHRDTKDLFYADIDSDIGIESTDLLNIFYDGDNGKLSTFSESESALFEKVFYAFKDKYNLRFQIVDNMNEYTTEKEAKDIADVVKEVSQEVLFQEAAVGDLVEQIYINQSINESDLPKKVQSNLKSNILFHGRFGTGKKSIIENLERVLEIPYADVSITPNFSDTMKEIIEQLTSRASSDEEASSGIVYFRDNFASLYEILGENMYTAPAYFMDKKLVSHNGHIIDFQKLTFVVLLDEYYDMGDYIDIDSVMLMSNCNFRATTRVLTDKQKYQVLISKNGRLTVFNEYLKRFNKRVRINSFCLQKLIRECSKIDPGMNTLNGILEGMMRESLTYGIHDLVINKYSVDTYVPAVKSYYSGDAVKRIEDKKEEPKTKEQKIEEIWDQQLDELTEVFKKDIIGQDKQIKIILYFLLENRRMIMRNDLDNPKEYVKNILVRGESGSGKTMLAERIKKYFKVPVVVVDSTQYTETGWVGDSVSDIFAALIRAANGNIEAAQEGIVIMDEGDKKAEDGRGGPGHKAFLENLYKAIEGSEIIVNIGSKNMEDKITFDTTRITFMFVGAFEGLEKIRAKRLGLTMGFGSQDAMAITAPFEDEDYIKYGFPKQFVARLGVCVELNKVTKESLLAIMKNSGSSKLKVEKFILADRGIELEYTDDFYDAFADKVLSMKIGARGIEKALNNILYGIGIQDIRSSEVEKIVFNKDVVSDPHNAIIYRRGAQKKLGDGK